MVALRVLIDRAFLHGFAASRQEGLPETLQARAVLHHHQSAIGTLHVGRATKRGCHLHAQFDGPRAEHVLVAYLEVARFAMVEYAVGIFALLLREVVLPSLVRHLAIGNVALDVEPSASEGQRPIVGEGNAHLRHRAGVDAQRLRSRTQLVVFQLHGLLLCADGESGLLPSSFDVGLLHDHMARVVVGNGYLHAVAHTPLAMVVGAERTFHAPEYIAVGGLQGTEALLVGVEPQWSLALGSAQLRLHAIADVLRQAGKETVLCG